jgi:hypothetical protein
MASIDFYTGGNGVAPVGGLGGSGLGFFGASFGASVSVGSYQTNTYVCDGNGVSQGPQANNITWAHSASGTVPTNVLLALTSIPNYQATLNVRFTHSSSVKLQNTLLYIYDRVSTSNPASGVTCAVANIIHPNTVQTTGGSGSSSWIFPQGTGYIALSTKGDGSLYSPGISGTSPNGPNTTSTQHDYYVALSASPNSIGSKTQFGLYVSTEYL